MLLDLRALGVSQLEVHQRSGESAAEQRHQASRESEDEKGGE
jgi:hypothetical protein